MKGSGNGAVRLNSQDNQAVFETDFEIDREKIDALRFAKRIEQDEEIDGSQSANDAREIYTSAANGLREVTEIYYVPSK